MTVDDFIAEWNNGEKYIVAHTSGSTGKPKEIMLSKDLVKMSALRTNKFFNIDCNSHLHLCLSPDYIAGKMMIVRALTAKATLTYESPTNTPLYNLIGKSKIDLLAIVPSQLPHILNHHKCCDIKNVIIGGSAIPDNLKQAIIKTGLTAYETYGMTETASHVALRKIENDSTSFTALPGIIFSTDNRSCLIIQIDNYDTIITNDIVELIDDYHFNYIGRIDNVIISGGLKIHPIEIENKIRHIIGNNIPFYITSRPHDKWGEEVILIIEDLYKSVIDTNRLIAKMKENLLYYQSPKDIIFVNKIDFTDSGKIIRNKF